MMNHPITAIMEIDRSLGGMCQIVDGMEKNETKKTLRQLLFDCQCNIKTVMLAYDEAIQKILELTEQIR